MRRHGDEGADVGYHRERSDLSGMDTGIVMMIHNVMGDWGVCMVFLAFSAGLGK